jgi:hypothetical protein
MKTLLKFSLLSALVITGKLAKQSTPTAVATTQSVEMKASPSNSVVMVNHISGSEPVTPVQEPVQHQQGGSGLLAELF